MSIAGNLLTRMGVKAHINGHNAIDNDKSLYSARFVEANWILQAIRSLPPA